MKKMRKTSPISFRKNDLTKVDYDAPMSLPTSKCSMQFAKEVRSGNSYQDISNIDTILVSRSVTSITNQEMDNIYNKCTWRMYNRIALKRSSFNDSSRRFDVTSQKGKHLAQSVEDQEYILGKRVDGDDPSFSTSSNVNVMNDDEDFYFFPLD